MKLSLVVLSEGKLKGHTLPITLSQFLVGRDSQCHLRPNSPAISKRHCAILVKAGRVFVRDFDSTNGTFINDERVKGEAEIQPDDKLKVGPLEFRVVIERSTPVNKPTPRPAQLRDAEDDDDVAALLLAMQDDSAVGIGDVPGGSTIYDAPAPTLGPTDSMPVGAGKPDDKKAEKPKEPMMKPSDAAKVALEKLLRGGSKKQ